MRNYFYFELVPYPASHLKEGVLRPASKNSILNTLWLKSVEAAMFVKDESVANEGAVLWW